MGTQPLGSAPLQLFGAYPWQAYVQPGNGHQPTPGMHRLAVPSTTLSRGSLMLLNQVSPSHSKYMVGHTTFGAWQSHLIALPSLHGGEGSSFPGLLPSDDIVNSESVVAIKPGDSGVVIGYQVDELTLQSGLLLIPTFILGSQVRCHH